MAASIFAVPLAGAALAWMPEPAGAEAVKGAEPQAGSSGLPDGRLYEQASPKNKIGSEAGAPVIGTPPYIVAGTAGNEVAFYKTGPFGETPAGVDYFSIAKRSATGWSTRAAVARGEGLQGAFRTNPQQGLGFSAEMTSSVFGAPSVFVPEQEQSSPTPHLYRYNEDGTVQWLGKPAVSEPFKFEGAEGSAEGALVGGSPNYETVYYSFDGILTPEEEEADPSLGGISRAQEMRALNESSTPPLSDSGFYEWHDGVLRYAGVLPNGHVDPWGASPAANVDEVEIYSPEVLNNEVSKDGSKAFFVSPDPSSGSGRPVEIYVRESAPDGSRKTVLVSRDELLEEVEGEAAPAPNGAVQGNGAKPGGSKGNNNEIRPSYVYASPDGSHVFFESTDQLTADAPSDETVKEYSFDTDTNTLTYLPGVADLASGTVHVLVSSRDGSDFLFRKENELEVWSGGAVSEIAAIESAYTDGPTLSRASASGSVFVFETNAPFPSLEFNNGGGAYEQVYRYQVATKELECVSCPPEGTVPSGNARLSNALPSGNLGNTFIDITGNRGISEDGSRVFFDTPDPLLKGDTNGVRDAYEWENGTRYLISSGVSTYESFFGDNSPSGNDVFFSTLEGLLPGDNDEGYDVYDARIPRPGDQLPPSAVPCEGAVCQGPPSVPQLLSTPASAAFEGAGQVSPTPPAHAATKSLARKQRLARALKACRHIKKGRKRARCVRQARRRYGAKASSTRLGAGHGNGNSQHNGRGK
ncbi:MAG: hypothetical protein ACTHM1_00935 [Solirubrobacteraceae bacterium]